jgi:hypothetical protein
MREVPMNQAFEDFFAGEKLMQLTAGIGTARTFTAHLPARFSTAFSTRVENVRRIRSAVVAVACVLSVS